MNAQHLRGKSEVISKMMKHGPLKVSLTKLEERNWILDHENFAARISNLSFQLLKLASSFLKLRKLFVR